jgi:hypothetical protein
MPAIIMHEGATYGIVVSRFHKVSILLKVLICVLTGGHRGSGSGHGSDIVTSWQECWHADRYSIILPFNHIVEMIYGPKNG